MAGVSGSTAYQILAPDHGPVAEVINPGGQAPLCLVCEHASAVIPASLGTLGLAPEHRQTHAVWDIGAEALARELSTRLDAPLVLATVSRLVYDLNRPPEAPDAMPHQSGEIPVPGNRDLSEAEKTARTKEVYDPFHATLSDVLDGFETPPTLVTIHSFAPVWHGTPRSTQLGLLHDADASLAEAMLNAADDTLVTHLNEPYSARDGVTHTLARHATARGLTNVMIEVRNDLLGEAIEVDRVATHLATLLNTALAPKAATA
ncbi:N-formylglutamate amidohydrolase [Roseovarius atlanticus]|uniref:N-formylglutamate amidohydrolase n=1 Tax=Roseovarius atlanticus TaxID=1641875 RepID=UPI001C94B545|nr:N-formylglutamate amidohydrolase [Roseovarius atlanticus]MBY6124384.1 N-formylglutamate amidohydrolase [Roseovarius atlanticus]MBY6148879.1 N-formylglutamate amidohydrolase [Roseovarius atlanticus]